MYSHTIKDMVAMVKEAGVLKDNVSGSETIMRLFEDYWEDKIALVWTVDDVLDCADRIGIDITESHAKEVLDIVLHRHDANYGVSWDTFSEYIEDFGTRR
jgi:hypothetical protein